MNMLIEHTRELFVFARFLSDLYQIDSRLTMQFRSVVVLCLTFLFSVFIGSTVSMNTGRVLSARARKISQVPWLSAPHFPAFSKRGRFVFRDAPADHLDESLVDDLDLLPDKRNWRF